jgi:hypothetical protein
MSVGLHAGMSHIHLRALQSASYFSPAYPIGRRYVVSVSADCTFWPCIRPSMNCRDPSTNPQNEMDCFCIVGEVRESRPCLPSLLCVCVQAPDHAAPIGKMSHSGGDHVSSLIEIGIYRTVCD